MEIKDILGLAFTFLFLIAFQFLGRSKKKPQPVPLHEAPQAIPRKKEKVLTKKVASQVSQNRALGMQQKSSSFIRDSAAYDIKIKQAPSALKTFLHDKKSLRTAFIMQEILQKPYD
ncbi:MAG: hypothetical protein NTX49_00220 [Chlamydiae bacterium]|nr:hypothetical protein [Chlamydiota bacterium]